MQPGRGSAKLLRRLVLLTLGLLALGGGTIVGYRWWQAADLGGANAAVTAQLYSWTQQAAAVKSFDDSFFAITIGCLLAFGPALFIRTRPTRAGAGPVEGGRVGGDNYSARPCDSSVTGWRSPGYSHLPD